MWKPEFGSSWVKDVQVGVLGLPNLSKGRKHEPENSIVDEVIRVIAAIVVSQEAEKAGKSREYYDAVGPNAHEIMAKKGVEISKAVYFSYETFRVEGHFIVVATALAKSGMKGKIIYESKTGKWAGIEATKE